MGAKWVYETPDGELESTVVSEVTKGDDGTLTVSRKGVDGTRTVYADVIVSAGGLQQQRDAADRVGWVLKATAKAGDSWDSPEGKRTVHGPEEVQVPAGKFTALRVDWVQNGATYTSWYAAGIGEVKRTKKLGDTETVTRALKSFQPKDGK